MTSQQQGFWSLRLAAGRIADDDARQLFLNGLSEIIRRAPSGKLLDRGLDAAGLGAADDALDCAFDIAVVCRHD
jgi:hypothetical protein